MVKLTDILSELLNEDRCKRIANRKYDKPSAYKSGAIVRCRKGNIWKGLKEDITANNKPTEDSFLTKALNSLSGFIRGKELNDFLNKIKTVATFDDYILKFSKGTEGANQFMIEILNKEDNDIIGKFVAFIYKDKETQKYSLQIQKVEIYPKYKGKGIMRKFYQEFNKWLKDNFDNFDKFTSDFIFLYNKDTGKYDGFSMWEDLVKKGLAKRLGPDQNYIPPTTPPKDGMWRIETGYALNENDDKIWKGLKEDWQDTSWTGEKGQKVTLKQLLDIIKDYPIIQAPIEKVEKIIIKKDTGGIESDRLSAADIKHPIIIVVDDNNNYKYVLDGNHRANKAIDTGLKSIPAKLVNISKLPDEFQSVLAEKQKESLHKWFKRQGAPGKSGGWVDCNTCRRDKSGKKKCKSCGRQKGEKRSKYPSCRPTPSQCSRPGKGKTWGKTNEAEINTEKIFPFEYTGTRKNTIDNTGGLLHTYTFDTDNNEYTVYFYDDKDGTYERVFGTVERNLAPTQEDIPFKIYRTVTAITLDFLDKVSGDKNFKQLEIEPISDQRGIVVKKFVNDYIAPKYDVEQVGKNIIIKNKETMINQKSLKEVEIDDSEISSKIAYFYELQDRIGSLSLELEKYKEEFKEFEELITPLMDSMKILKDKVAKTDNYVINIVRAGGDKSNYSYKTAFEVSLTKVNASIRRILEEELEATKSISKVKHSFKIDKLSEAKSSEKARNFVRRITNVVTNNIKKEFNVIDTANKILQKLSSKA